MRIYCVHDAPHLDTHILPRLFSPSSSSCARDAKNNCSLWLCLSYYRSTNNANKEATITHSNAQIPTLLLQTRFFFFYIIYLYSLYAHKKKWDFLLSFKLIKEKIRNGKNYMMIIINKNNCNFLLFPVKYSR